MKSTSAARRDYRTRPGETNQNGPKIRELMTGRGWDLEEFAEVLDIHYEALRHIVNESRNASDRMVRRIALALGVESEKLRRPDNPAQVA